MDGSQEALFIRSDIQEATKKRRR